MTDTCPTCGQRIRPKSDAPVGRPVAKSPPPAVAKAMSLVARGKTVTEAVRKTGCARRTLERWLKKTRQAGES